MPEKDLDFCVYSNRELLMALSIALLHSHLVKINIYFPKWEGGERICQECLYLIQILKHVEVNVIADY
jgi:hypothetical protein